jgi:hypothetical protein
MCCAQFLKSHAATEHNDFCPSLHLADIGDPRMGRFERRIWSQIAKYFCLNRTGNVDVFWFEFRLSEPVERSTFC